ncbi:MAG TPA: hypothetical protein VMY39_02285 [Planctomycetota bacterium]|nr:hypothetical protein [Planctomycetota bacterium]HUV38407.1 hypothetical protein [Planctomycetota bacterium]
MAENGKSKVLLIIVVIVAIGVAAAVYFGLQPKEGSPEDFECVSSTLVDVKDATVKDADGNDQDVKTGSLVVKIKNKSQTDYASVLAQVVFLKDGARVGEQNVVFTDMTPGKEAESKVLVKVIPDHDTMKCNFINPVPK